MSRPLTPRTKRERMPGGSVAVSSGVASIGSSRYYLRTLNLWRNHFFAFQPSLAFDPGQAVLDPGRRPGTPRHGEELEPFSTKKFGSIPGGMKYIPAAMPRLAAAAAILSSAR